MNIFSAITGLFLALWAGQAFAAEKYEMRFQFDQNGTPSMHSFRLKWAAPDANLQTIDVFVADTKEVIQTIAIPQDGSIRLIYNDLINSRPNEIKDQFIDSLDYNFDKYADLRLTMQWPYKVGAKYYLIWLFSEEKNQYVLNEAISALPGPVPNPKKRWIETTTLGGFGGGEFVKRGFSIGDNGKLKLQMRITQSLSDSVRFKFIRDVRVREGGELQRVCKLEVPPEGLPKRIYGHRDTCAPYMEKEL